jgi:transcription factor MYC2
MEREMQDLSFAGAKTVMTSYPKPTTSPAFQEKLEILFLSRPEWWVYAILWRFSQNREEQLLSFGNGHFRGKNEQDQKKLQKTYNCFASLLADDIVTSSNIVNGTCTDDDGLEFYLVSLTYSFGTSDAGVSPVRAYLSQMPIWLAGAQALVGDQCGCERSREAQMHGIETIVWFPVSEGVLELGSFDLIQQDMALIQQVSFSYRLVSKTLK